MVPGARATLAVRPSVVLEMLAHATTTLSPTGPHACKHQVAMFHPSISNSRDKPIWRPLANDFIDT